MSYITKVIYSKYSDFSNEMDVTESGKPASVELNDLNDDTTYYTKAQLRDGNGILLDESAATTFQTLQAGVITLTSGSTTRSGNNYIVTYTYSSTYALSSAIMSINSINVQGIIAGNNITFTISGLTHGNTYPYTITATDIYTETSTTSGTITTTAVNNVSITSTVAAETSMRLNLSYQTDSGFRSGYGEYWAMGDDPDTDQPVSYAFFNEGDTYVVVPNLSSETQYQFRATIELQDNTEVYSSVVVARTTAHDYSQDYFTIKNESNGYNNIYMGPGSSSNYKRISLYVSTDNGANWNLKSISNNIVNLATLGQGESLLMKHTGALSELGKYNQFRSDGKYSVSGNIASLCFGDNFNTGSALTMPDYAYAYLFSYNVNNQAANLVSVENLNFSSYIAVSTTGMREMFKNCTSLTTGPDLSNITTVGYTGMYGMFEGCTSLTTSPDLSNIKSVGVYGIPRMFYGCTSLTTVPDLSNVTTVNDNCMFSMFYGCTGLTTPPDLSSITSVGDYGMQNMFYGCTSLTTMPDLSNVVSVGNNGMESIFYNCSSLVNVSDFDSLTTVGQYGFQAAFSSCDSLETAPNFNSVTTAEKYAFDQLYSLDVNLKSASGFDSLTTVSYYTFYAAYFKCTSLETGSDLRKITSANNYSFTNMYQGCSSLSEAYAPTITWDTFKTNNWLDGVYTTGTLYADSSIAAGIPTSNPSGCPTGWTVSPV